ncbi:MAG: chromate transporter [Cyanobacteria bacterium RYN_339]|nr:chromate transporter [Cyanobacteria bacterium RYN_339]
MSNEPSLPSLVAVFARVGMLAFGGGVTSHLLVQFSRRGWLTDAQYLDAVSWCQNLPGPNATNLSAFLGWRFGGGLGAVLCTVALVLPGAVLVLLLSHLLATVPQQAVVRGGLAAVAAAAVGLLIAAMWQLGASARLRGLRGLAMAVTAVGVALGVPTPVAIAVMVALLWPRREGPDAGAA